MENLAFWWIFFSRQNQTKRADVRSIHRGLKLSTVQQECTTRPSLDVGRLIIHAADSLQDWLLCNVQVKKHGDHNYFNIFSKKPPSSIMFSSLFYCCKLVCICFVFNNFSVLISYREATASLSGCINYPRRIIYIHTAYVSFFFNWFSYVHYIRYLMTELNDINDVTEG